MARVLRRVWWPQLNSRRDIVRWNCLPPAIKALSLRRFWRQRLLRERMLPSWWAREQHTLSSHAASPGAAIEDGAAAFDDATIVERLCSRQFAVIDGFLGPVAAAAVRGGIVTMERDGLLRVGKLQHGLTQTSDQTSRSDRIAFLPKDGQGCSEALQCYVEQIDLIRERLSDHENLVELVDGSLDGCNFMAASYPCLLYTSPSPRDS